MRAVLRDLGLFLLRLTTGWILFVNGTTKVGNLGPFVAGLEKGGYPIPEVLGPAAAYSEFLGGIFLLLGLLTPAAALFAASTMGTAAIYHHMIGRWGGVDPSLGLIEKIGATIDATKATGWEPALALLGGCLCILFSGPGRWSLDALILRGFRRKRRRPPAPGAEAAPPPAVGSTEDSTSLEDLLGD